MTLRSLDQNESVEACVIRPDRYRQLEQALKRSSFAIPRGQGLSYCLASGGKNSTSILMARFDRILAFDAEKQTIEVEAGLSLRELLRFLIPRGFWFPVLPGYPTITIGGALAMNIHGKSQYHDGLFGDHVEEFRLLHPDHPEICASRTLLPDLFTLTIGGMGLTGIVTRVKLRIQQLPGKSIQRQRFQARNLQHAAELMLELHEKNEENGKADQIYSWNDLNLSGAKWGSGFIYQESFVDCESNRSFHTGNLNSQLGRSLVPKFCLPLALKAINPVYRCLEILNKKRQTFDLFTGAFPINGKEVYFRTIARLGFHESQIIVPKSEWPRFSTQLSALLRKYSVTTTLGSLKIFRGQPSLLNYRQDGICIALDMPAQNGYEAFMTSLDELMLESDGLPNISKDSHLSSAVVAAAYSGYAEFKSRLKRFDPNCRMQSALRARIDV